MQVRTAEQQAQGTSISTSDAVDTSGSTGFDTENISKTTPSAVDTENTSQTTSDAVEVTKEPELRFMAMGDIMLGRGVGMRLKKAGSYIKAFEKISGYVKQGDIIFANLETPLTTSNHGLDKKGKIVLKSNPDAVSALTSAGINIVSLANNHMMDYYETGLFDTISILQKNNILFAGAGKNMDEARKPVIIEKNGIRIGFVSYTYCCLLRMQQPVPHHPTPP
jgi:poly-gamma-glutamate synthesis protein (capsule biosynthesis protein)